MVTASTPGSARTRLEVHNGAAHPCWILALELPGDSGPAGEIFGWADDSLLVGVAHDLHLSFSSGRLHRLWLGRGRSGAHQPNAQERRGVRGKPYEHG